MTNGIVIGLSALAGVWMGWIALPVCMLVLLAIRLVERNRALDVFVICLLFASIGSWRSVEPAATTTNTDIAISTGAIGKVASFPVPSGDGHRTVMEIEQICIGESCVPAEELVVVYIPLQSTALARGQRLRLDWRFDALQSLAPGYRTFVQSQGAIGSARAVRVELLESGPPLLQWMASANQHVSRQIEALLPGNTGALANGVITGDDSGLDSQVRKQFRITNTTHLTAVSGQNVGIILGFVSFWFRPKTSSKRAILHIGLILVVWSFTAFVGMQPSSLRAALLATFIILGQHVGRKTDPVTLLSLILGSMAVMQPLVVHNVGFWLSAVASMALCLTLPSQVLHHQSKAVAEIAIGPIVASVATMPIMLSAFGAWSPVGILTNMLLAPVMTLAFAASYLFAMIAIILPGFAVYLAWIPGILLDTALAIIGWMAPIASQVRIDVLSPALLVLVWSPIIIGIWLLSDESDRWIRRLVIRRLP